MKETLYPTGMNGGVVKPAAGAVVVVVVVVVVVATGWQLWKTGIAQAGNRFPVQKALPGFLEQ